MFHVRNRLAKQATSTDGLLGLASVILICLCLLLLCTSCSSPPRDRDNRLPRDVVETFLRLATDGEYEKAKGLWVEKPLDDPQHLRISFREHAARYSDLRSVHLGRAVKEKGEYWSVWIRARTASGEEFDQPVHLAMREGKWKLVLEGGLGWAD